MFRCFVLLMLITSFKSFAGRTIPLNNNLGEITNNASSVNVHRFGGNDDDSVLTVIILGASVSFYTQDNKKS